MTGWMKCTSLAAAIGAAAIVALHGDELAAFSEPSYFSHAASEGGGGNRWFTGSANDGLTCDVCHGGKDLKDLTVTGLPSGAYMPGQQYTITVAWPAAAGRVAFTAEITDAQGHAVGLINTPELAQALVEIPELYPLSDGRLIVAQSPYWDHPMTQFQWTAPASMIKGTHFYLAAVAGNGLDGPLGDRVLALDTALAPELAGSDRAPNDIQCAAASAPTGYGRGVVVAIALLALAWWRHRARPGVAAALGVLVVAGSASACVTVRPYERGRLAQSDMLLDGAPDLLSGQEHATEYREGSAGGFGGAGGGCGCN